MRVAGSLGLGSNPSKNLLGDLLLQRFTLTTPKLAGIKEPRDCRDCNFAHHAIASNNISLLKQIIDKRPELLNDSNREGMTPAFFAALFDNTEALKLIIEKAPESLSTRSSDGYNTPTVAVRNRSLASIAVIAKLKLELLSEEDAKGRTALTEIFSINPRQSYFDFRQLAREIEAEEFINQVLNLDPSFRLEQNTGRRRRYTEGCNLAHHAVFENHLDLLELIIELKPEILNETSDENMTPAFLAAVLDRPEALELIAEKNLESLLIESNSGYNTPTMAAYSSRYGDRQSIVLLAKLKPELLSVQDAQGRTAFTELFPRRYEEAEVFSWLIEAVRTDEFVKQVLAAEVRVDFTDMDQNISSGNSNLAHHAVYQNDIELLERIIELKPELLDGLNRDGRTPAYLAGVLNDAEALELIINHDPKSLLIQANNGYNTPTIVARLSSEHGTTASIDTISDLCPISYLLENVSVEDYHPRGNSRITTNPIGQLFLRHPEYFHSFLTKELEERGSTNLEEVNRAFKSLSIALPSRVRTGARGFNLAHYAVIQNDLDLLEQVTELLPDLLSDINDDGVTPAFLAGVLDRDEVLEFIIEKEPNSLLTVSQSGHNTPTIVAYLCGENRARAISSIVNLKPEFLDEPDGQERRAIETMSRSHRRLLLDLYSGAPERSRRTLESILELDWSSVE